MGAGRLCFPGASYQVGQWEVVVTPWPPGLVEGPAAALGAGIFSHTDVARSVPHLCGLENFLL